MRLLFFLVHPAKFHFHKVQINELMSKGHIVDIVIIKKDILEELVRLEGWDYTNIFPEGRKIKGLHVYLAALVSMVRTVVRLLRYTRGKKYDIFVGDLLTIVGRIKGVPTFYPTDDVLRQVPEQRLFLITTKYIIAPKITDLGKFNNKTINYNGIKALAHLHPKHFKPNINLLPETLRDKDYFLIRCVKFSATHDINKNGINDLVLRKIVSILRPFGEIIISAERNLPPDLVQYEADLKKNDIAHYISYAKILIADSTTMCSEAAILGTPSIEYDNYFSEIEQMVQLKDEFELITCIEPPDEDKLVKSIIEMINLPDIKMTYARKRDSYLKEMIDVSAFIIWILENYPRSILQYKTNPSIQNMFR